MAISFSVTHGAGGGSRLRKTLLKHFNLPPGEIATAERQFPITSRMDVQSALQELFGTLPGSSLLGITTMHHGELPSLGNMLAGANAYVDAGPLQYDDIDIGEATPARCLKNALWISRDEALPFAVMMAPAGRFGMGKGVQVEIGVPLGESGARLSTEFFRKLEILVGQGRTYRGRIISLEAQIDAMGGGSMVKVHRLPKIDRASVILPGKTLATLDHNVGEFMAARERLKALRFQARKGLLFYGPPGTGKTFTIHYLASQLTNHTTLLITAGQVGFLGEYFRLARFLQPSLMVIEDVDLIARERTHMHGAAEELLLNKLLNEMDGLQQDAEVLVILTTNRPEQIEPALVSRPGRIDQAIEFPLPNEEGRAKLTKLYARGLELPDDVLELIVSQTKGVSAAFIKELMRRCAQFQIESSGGSVLGKAAVDAAIEEMIFAGGALNRRLLGGDGADQGPGRSGQLRIST